MEKCYHFFIRNTGDLFTFKIGWKICVANGITKEAEGSFPGLIPTLKKTFLESEVKIAKSHFEEEMRKFKASSSIKIVKS